MDEWQRTCDQGARAGILDRLPEAHRGEIAAWMDRLAADYAKREDV